MAPVAGADDAHDAVRTMGVADEHDARIHLAEQPPAQLSSGAMGGVKDHQGAVIVEGALGVRKINSVGCQIGGLFVRIPREAHEGESVKGNRKTISEIKMRQSDGRGRRRICFADLDALWVTEDTEGAQRARSRKVA